jgi:hypothetical protein
VRRLRASRYDAGVRSTSPGPTSPRRSTAGRTRAALIAAVVAASAGACGLPEVRTEGALHASGGLRPLTACLSGDRRSFFGVDLIEEGGRTLRIVDDPIYGIRGRYMGAGLPENGVVLDASTCRSLRGVIQRTGWRVGHILVLEGNVSLDCTLPDGTPLRGELRFGGCA